MKNIKRTVQELEEFLLINPTTTAIYARVIDVNGRTLGKRVPISEAASLAEVGLSFSAVTPLRDSRGVGQNPGGRGQSDGNPDSIYLPIAGTLRPVPWTRRPVAQWLCAPYAGPAIEIDPRRILQNVIEMCLTEGRCPVVACELEFYLLASCPDASGYPQPAPLSRTGTAPPTIGGLSLSLLDDLDDVLQRIEHAAADQGPALLGDDLRDGGVNRRLILDVQLDCTNVDAMLAGIDRACSTFSSENVRIEVYTVCPTSASA